MQENKTMVAMTEEEKAQYEAFKKEQERKAALEAKKQQRADLQALTDDVMNEAVAELKECSAQLKATKEKIMDTFRSLMEMRKEVNEEAGKKEQDSYQFSNTEATMRIRIGYNMNDNYLDSAEEGIAKVKAYLSSLAKDEESQKIIAMVMQLLAKDQQGNLNAKRVLQLWKMAQESGDEGFKEGVEIIQQSYRPIRSKLYIRCQVKEEGENGVSMWNDVPLGLTEV